MSETTSRTAVRRRRAVIALLAVAIGLVAWPGSASAQVAGQRPNVIVIMTDDQTRR